jgi:adenine-specific DNA-methyltransferase
MAKAREVTGSELTFVPDSNSKVDLAAERKTLTVRAAARTGDDRVAFARAATASVLVHYWNKVSATHGRVLPLRLGPTPSIEVPSHGFRSYADECGTLETFEAFYQIGELYTSLLPDEYRAHHGIFYTPPALVKRLLDVVEAQGIDWGTVRVLDPACGGAAFAAYVAQRMLDANTHLPSADRLRDLKARLIGLEIDPFATWLSAVLLDVVCLPVSHQANTHLDGIIQLVDSLSQFVPHLGEFDLVVGNPPYGKVKLTPAQRERFGRSLYGHANLYGLFTDLAVAVTKPKGFIAFVTPTSFLGGEYFKNLRCFLLTEAAPVHASFVSDREGVFTTVLQETVLTVFRRASASRHVKARPVQRLIGVETIFTGPRHGIQLDPLGKVAIGTNTHAPWVLPRSRDQLALVRELGRMKARLTDYGYRVATGQLVWNRHKPQFRDRSGVDCYPVLWAECIQPDGTFEFRAQKRNHQPYIHVEPDQQFLVNQEPCVLVQRTTSKEQVRRLVAATIPNSFIVDHPGYVVENHVNMLLPISIRPAVPLSVIARVLNSDIVDRAFRCISGSVAVSAYELESLPLPDVAELRRRVSFSRMNPSSASFEQAIRSLYHTA